MAITLQKTDTVQLATKDSSGNTRYAYVIKNKAGEVMWRKCKPVLVSFDTTQITKVGIDRDYGDGMNSEYLTTPGTIYVEAGTTVYINAETYASGYEAGDSTSVTYNLSNVSTLTESSFYQGSVTLTAKAASISVSNASFALSGESIKITGKNATSVDFSSITFRFDVYTGKNESLTNVGRYTLSKDTIAKGKSFEFVTTGINNNTFGYTIDSSSVQKLIIFIACTYVNSSGVETSGTTITLYGSSAKSDHDDSTTTTAKTLLGSEESSSCVFTIS